MFVLSKTLPLLVLPLGVTLWLLVWALWRKRRAPLWAALLMLLVSSNPMVARSMMRATEGWAERMPASAAPPADAIVVLSAGRQVAPGPAMVSEWGDANRFFGGVELYQSGKAPLLVFTGASPVLSAPDAPEGEILRRHAMAYGVPADRIAVSGAVLNTRDEAREVSALLKARGLAQAKVLLVTSAFHMRRARALFEAEGLQVTPFPVHFSGEDRAFSVLDLLPSAGALTQSQTAIREFYGRGYNWIRGGLR